MCGSPSPSSESIVIMQCILVQSLWKCILRCMRYSRGCSLIFSSWKWASSQPKQRSHFNTYAEWFLGWAFFQAVYTLKNKLKSQLNQQIFPQVLFIEGIGVFTATWLPQTSSSLYPSPIFITIQSLERIARIVLNQLENRIFGRAMAWYYFTINMVPVDNVEDNRTFLIFLLFIISRTFNSANGGWTHY